MKVEFDIKYRPQIESGEYQVVTNNGRKVRIICWDAVAPDREQDIIALVTNSYGDSENILRYYNNGKLISDSAGVGDKDLCVIIPVKCNVGDWVKYNGNVYAITSIDGSGYKVTLLDGDEEDACTAISFAAVDNMARLVEKPEFSYFQESLAYSLNCEFMGVTLDECEYFAAKYGKELEDAVLKEHPMPAPEKEAEKKWTPKFKEGDFFIYNGMCQEAKIYEIKRVVQGGCVSGYWCERFDAPTMGHAWFSSSEEKYMEPYEPEPEEEDANEYTTEVAYNTGYSNGYDAGFEEGKKVTEWGKEDEAHRAFILESLENQIRFCKKDAEGAYYAKQIRTAQNWLKFLRLKSHWKPTEEQMDELEKVSSGNTCAFNYGILRKLYDDLKNNYYEN